MPRRKRTRRLEDMELKELEKARKVIYKKLGLIPKIGTPVPITNVPAIDLVGLPFAEDTIREEIRNSFISPTMSAAQAAEAATANPLALNIKYLPSHLRYKNRDLLFDMYGVHDFIETYGAPTRWFSEKEEITKKVAGKGERLLDYKRPYGRYEIDLKGILAARDAELGAGMGEITPAEAYFATTNFQFNNREILDIAQQMFETGDTDGKLLGRMISPTMTTRTSYNITELAKQLTRSLRGEGAHKDAAKVVVWDFETGGLSERSGIWQFAAHIMDTKTGKIEQTRKIHISNNLMKFGLIGPTGRSLAERAYEGVRPEDIMDSYDALREILNVMDMAQFNMAGHNINFDIEQMLHLIATHQSRIDAEPDKHVARLVTKFKEALGSGKVVDTAALSSALLGGRSELAQVLRTSNVLEHASPEVLEKLGDLHDSAVDSELTALVLHVAGTGRLRELTEEEQALAYSKFKLKRLEKKEILSPFARTTDISQVHAELRERLNIEDAMSWDPETGRMVNIFDKKAGRGLSPMEQMILKSRASRTVADPEAVMTSSGIQQNIQALSDFLGHYTGTSAGNVPTVRPGSRSALLASGFTGDLMGDFELLQSRIAASGGPGSTMGVQERITTAALARASEFRGLEVGEAIDLDPVRELLGVAGWRSQAEIGIQEFRGSGNKLGYLPQEVLREALKDTEYTSALRLDAFTTSRGFSSALMFEFGDDNAQEQVDAILTHLQGLVSNPEYVDEKAQIQALITELENPESYTRRYGLQLSFNESNQAVHEALATMTEIGAGGAAQRSSVKVSWLAGVQDHLGTESDVILTGDVIPDLVLKDKSGGVIMDPRMLASEAEGSILGTIKGFERLAEEGTLSISSPVDRNPIPVRRLRGGIPVDEEAEAAATTVAGEADRYFLGRLTGGAPEDFMNKIIDRFFTKPVSVVKAHPKIGVGAALAVGAGYYFMRKRKERDPYYDTIERQDTESNSGFKANYQRAQDRDIDTLTSPYQDPLATAGLIQNLHARKSGHHAMGPNKYGHLFGG